MACLSLMFGNGPPRQTRQRTGGGWPRRLMLAAVVLSVVPSAAQAYGPGAFWFFFKVFGVIAGHAKITDMQASRAYKAAPRAGTCAERRERIVKILPDALRLSRYVRDIYEHIAQLKAAGLKTMDLGDGRQAIYEPTGQRYAEIRVDAARHEVIVVFRGTRLTVGSDISTDVLSVTGIETAYYRWASSLVAQVAHEHAGMRVIVTGHSLGGGLVLYAVLRNPGVEGIAFNPVGLSWLTWLTTRRAERARTNSALTVISTRNANHIEPLTALSLAHRTVLPGQLFFVETEATGSLSLHGAVTVVTALERLTANEAEGSACDGVLGALAH
jgi:hypothetical protein